MFRHDHRNVGTFCSPCPHSSNLNWKYECKQMKYGCISFQDKPKFVFDLYHIYTNRQNLGISQVFGASMILKHSHCFINLGYNLNLNSICNLWETLRRNKILGNSWATLERHNFLANLCVEL